VIPDIRAVETAAAAVLGLIPPGLTRGEVPAGLYGLGFLGRWALPRLVERGVRLVSCHDANRALAGTFAEGLPVYSVSELKQHPPEFLVVAARHAVKPVSAMLSDLGIPHVSCDAWHVASDLAAFRHVHDDILGDERSREVLRAVLMAMLTGDRSHCEAVSEPDQYFCLPRFHGSDAETYVDAGAYVGDSTERFISAHSGMFSKIYAFEPGPRQFAALQVSAARLRRQWRLDPASIELVNAALGEAEGVSCAASGNGEMTSLAVGACAAGAITVQVVSLDHFLKSRPVSFLKADVEGMEMALLRGAQATIRRYKPKVSICVYHYPGDIPEIAGYLRELAPDYRFALRHHSRELMETVLYCWTK
jgi:FkbM family methyltransferase